MDSRRPQCRELRPCRKSLPDRKLRENDPGRLKCEGLTPPETPRMVDPCAIIGEMRSPGSLARSPRLSCEKSSGFLREAPSLLREVLGFLSRSPESLARSPRVSCEKSSGFLREALGFLARSPRASCEKSSVSCEKPWGFLREVLGLLREAPSLLREARGLLREGDRFFAASWSGFVFDKNTPWNQQVTRYRDSSIPSRVSLGGHTYAGPIRTVRCG